MPDLGVAHLAFGKTDGKASRVKLGIWINRGKSFDVFYSGKLYGVAVFLTVNAPAVQHYKHYGFHFDPFGFAQGRYRTPFAPSTQLRAGFNGNKALPL